MSIIHICIYYTYIYRDIYRYRYRYISLARHSVADNRNSYECFGAWHDLILPFEVSLPVECYCFEKGPHHLGKL